jgi:fructokinase
MGGTKCILTLSRGPNDLNDRVVVPTSDPATTLAAIEAQLDRWKDEACFAAIGIAGFGPLQLDPRQPDFGAIIATPKPGWSGINAYARIAARYAVPIALQTDVNGAALAEGRWGGAQGMESHAYITVGTGVGVGLIVGGRPLVGLTHSEMGHIRLNRAQGDAWPGSCPFHGDCVEGLIAGPAIAARLGLPLGWQKDEPRNHKSARRNGSIS